MFVFIQKSPDSKLFVSYPDTPVWLASSLVVCCPCVYLSIFKLGIPRETSLNMDWLPQDCGSIWGRFLLIRYNFVLVQEPCVLPCVNMFTNILYIFDCGSDPVSESLKLRFVSSSVSLSCLLLIPFLLFFFFLSLSPSVSSLPVFLCCLFPSLCVFMSVLLSEVWSRESYYERLWKVEVTTLLCQL